MSAGGELTALEPVSTAQVVAVHQAAAARTSALPWVVSASAPFALAASGFAAVAPLWAVDDLGADAAGWARLSALRFLGTLAGSVLVGVLSARLPPRRLLIGVLVLAMLAMCGLARGLAVAALMPVMGAAISAAFVAFNALVQSAERRAHANAWYRGVGAVAGVAAPLAIIAVAAACGSYAAALGVIAAALGLSAIVLLAGPRATTPTDRDGMGWRGYRRAFSHRPLLRFMLLAEAASAATLAMGAFAALRLVTRLDLPQLTFAACAGGAGALGVGVIALLGRIGESRSASRLLALLAVVSGAASALFSACESAPAAAAAFMAATAATTAWGVPLSLGLARRAGPVAFDCVFAAHKTLQALMTVSVMTALSVVEPLIGLRGAIVLCAVASMACAVALGRLREAEGEALRCPR